MKHHLNILFSVCFIIYSCKSSKVVDEFKIEKSDTIQFINVPLTNLAANILKYDGKYIETEGIFREGFEEFAIFVNDSLGSRGLWLNLDENLNTKNINFKSLNKTKLRIRGKVDRWNTGHMGSYVGSITNIYYIKSIR